MTATVETGLDSGKTGPPTVQGKPQGNESVLRGMTEKIPRPIGVSALAILELAAGILVLIGGAMLLVAGVLDLISPIPPFFQPLILAFVALMGVLLIVVGYGMWSGESWAWKSAVLLYGFAIISSLVSIGAGANAASQGLLIFTYLVILWYLRKPKVKAYFAKETLRN